MPPAASKRRRSRKKRRDAAMSKRRARVAAFTASMFSNAPRTAPRKRAQEARPEARSEAAQQLAKDKVVIVAARWVHACARVSRPIERRHTHLLGSGILHAGTYAALQPLLPRLAAGDQPRCLRLLGRCELRVLARQHHVACDLRPERKLLCVCERTGARRIGRRPHRRPREVPAPVRSGEIRRRDERHAHAVASRRKRQRPAR